MANPIGACQNCSFKGDFVTVTVFQGSAPHRKAVQGYMCRKCGSLYVKKDKEQTQK